MSSKNDTRLCPRCHKVYQGFPALSRWDNLTEICSNCGVLEAFEYPTARIDQTSKSWNPLNVRHCRERPYWRRGSNYTKTLEHKYIVFLLKYSEKIYNQRKDTELNCM